MTIPVQTVRAQYTGDGVTVAFAIPFVFYAATDISVLIGGVIQTVGFNITGGNDGTGTCTFAIAPVLSAPITIVLTPPLQQTVNLQNGQALPPSTLNQQADRVVMLIQRAFDLLGRSISAPDGDVGPSMTLPAAAARGNTIIGFDPTGLFLSLYSTIPTGTLTQAIFNAMFGVSLSSGQLYAQTQAETLAGVAPVNFQYPAYTVDRYGTNSIPGTTDMWQAIFNANACATQAGATVNFIPGEVYGINVTAHGAGLTFSANWVGLDTIIQRLDYTTTTAYYTALAISQSNLLLRGLIFDGQVTTRAAGSTPNVDLGPVGSFNDNFTETLWSAPYGVVFKSTQFCTVEDCTFRNFLRAGLRFETGNISGPTVPSTTPPVPPYPAALSLGNKVVNCRTYRTRGIYGDSFYQQDTENTQFVNCYAYDYQRIGFVNEFGTVGSNGAQYTNCVADFGHDAVTSGNQSNVGFWDECVDGMSMVNCEAKSTSTGYVINSVSVPNMGVWRAYTGSISLNGCRAVRCNSKGFQLYFGGSRFVHCVVNACFAEVNQAAATYSSGVGIGGFGFLCGYVPSAPAYGAGTTSTLAGHLEITNCGVDMVDYSGFSTAAAVNCYQGTVTNPQQFQLNIDRLSTRWLTTAGAYDTGAITAYESTTAPNYGYFGDIVFTGANNLGSRFNGRAKISNCSNETTGYIMLSSELTGGELQVTNTSLSLRTGGATSNAGNLFLRDCIFDVRGDIVWTQAFISNSIMQDWDTSNKDRTAWSCSLLKCNQVQFTRQLYHNLQLAASSSTNRIFRAQFTGCEWFLKFNVEAGYQYVNGAAGTLYGEMAMNGCVFRDAGSSAASGVMVLGNFASGPTIQVSGAGNAFDNNFVGGGGHVWEVNTTPTYNDVPTSGTAPYLSSAFGVLQVFGAN